MGKCWYEKIRNAEMINGMDGVPELKRNFNKE